MSYVLTALAIALLIFCSAFFAGSETALTAASRARMHVLEEERVRGARSANILMGNRERLIGALLLGNNVANILASALATSVFLQIFGEAGVAYATVVMTALVLIFAEVLPKTLAISDPDRFALLTSPLVIVMVKAASPVLNTVQRIVRMTLTLFGIDVDATRPVLSAQEELRGTLAVQHQEGGIEAKDRDRFGGLLDLADLEVADVMVHRKKMVLVNADDPPGDIVAQVLSSPNTRIPLWRGEPENIVGVLHAKDLLRAINAVSGDIAKIDIVPLLSEPWFVPETTTLYDQLDAFLKRRGHLALVVDEYGALMGLVTLEDILEEIFGDIRDEHDLAPSGIRIQADGSVVAEGTVPIRDLNRLMAWALPDEEATTIAGLVIHEAQTIPAEGQTFAFYGFKFEILRRQRNQITSLRISPPKTLAAATQAA
jgi:Mg2+/Co2+ transporter CorB